MQTSFDAIVVGSGIAASVAGCHTCASTLNTTRLLL